MTPQSLTGLARSLSMSECTMTQKRARTRTLAQVCSRSSTHTHARPCFTCSRPEDMKSTLSPALRDAHALDFSRPNGEQTLGRLPHPRSSTKAAIRARLWYPLPFVHECTRHLCGAVLRRGRCTLHARLRRAEAAPAARKFLLFPTSMRCGSILNSGPIQILDRSIQILIRFRTEF